LTKGKVHSWSVESEVLKDNPLGDSAERVVCVYLPPDHDVADCRGLPLILLLPGFGGRGRMMLADNLWSPAIDDRMDQLIASGSPPAVLALPDCSTALGGSQYINSAAVGRYQDHIVREVVPYLRDRLGTGRTGVAGKSSGGYGALRLGMEAPETFSAVACHSGDCYFEYGYLPDIPKAAAAITRSGSVKEFLNEFHSREKKTSEQIIALSILAMSACYSPRGDSNGYDLPFDPETGAYRPEVFEQWLAHDPYRMVAAHKNALASLELLLLDVGSRDEFHLQLGARLLHQRLLELDVEHRYEEFEDGHFSTSYRYGVSIPLLAEALSRQKP
jgi:enterochelin esterase family protein